ncbi:DUF4342 domain-containing protein [Bacteroidota bacterium]
MSAGFKVNGKDLINKIEEIIKEGNVRRIIIKNEDGKTYMEIPLAIGVIGVLAAPIVTALGAIAGLIANFSIEIIKKEDGNTVEVTEVKE